jgi:predicted amidohydrolase YtcJ
MRKFFVYSLLLAIVACQSNMQVDTIVHNAVIYTVDSAFTIAEAMAVKDGKIVATGKNDDILNRFGAKETINAQGKPVYPGFIDAHAHFLGYGQSLFQVNLFGCSTWDEVVSRVQDFAAKHPNEPWIKGRGWDQNKFPGKQYPTNNKLNELFPNKPVFLTRVDGHAAIANQKALDMAGVNVGATLTGGEIEIKNGKLTGILIDNATNLVENILPKPTKADYEKWRKTIALHKGLQRLQIAA